MVISGNNFVRNERRVKVQEILFDSTSTNHLFVRKVSSQILACFDIMDRRHSDAWLSTTVVSAQKAII